MNTPSERPYVYFRAEPSQRGKEYCYSMPGNPPTYDLKKIPNTMPNTYIKPYWDVSSGGFVNPDSCQVLCAGLDGEFGDGNAFPTGMATSPAPPGWLNKYDAANQDDQTNFLQGTVQDEVP